HDVGLGHAQDDAAVLEPDRANARQVVQAGLVGGGLALGDGELDDVVAAQPGDQLARGAQGDDLAVVDDRDAIAKALGLVHVVRRQQDGAAAATDGPDDAPELAARLRV